MDREDRNRIRRRSGLVSANGGRSAARGRRALVLAAALVLCAALAGAALAASTNFVEPATSPETVGDYPRSVAAADLDGDGDRDLAVANEHADNVTILRNNGAGNFGQPATSPEAVGNAPMSVAAADLDGDGDQDLAVANQLSNNVTILRNGGKGNFVEPGSSPEAAGDWPQSIAVADLDGDGDPDLAVANPVSNKVTILRNDGGGNVVEPGSSPEAAGSFPCSVAAADLDGDADPDLAVANLYSANVTILRNR